MIDFETTIFNQVYKTVAPLCAKKRFVSSIITETPTAFPAASLIEMRNDTVREKQTNTPKECFADVMYQLEVFDKTKAGCRKVFAAADEAMTELNFTRVSGAYIGNAGNAGVFRYTARYEARLDPEGRIYRTP